MVTIQKKMVRGRTYFYLVKSVRLPDGKVKRIDKILNKREKMLGIKTLEKRYSDYFLHKEKEISAKFMQKSIKKSYIFSEDEIAKLEDIRVSYKYLLQKLTKNQLRDIFDRFTVNFTYNSNAIEGNSLTLKDVRIVLLENGVVGGKDLREIYETRNSRHVIDLILKRKFKLTHEDMIKMHRLLMKDIDERAGYKKIPNVIISAGREIQTTKPEDVKKEMSSLIDWYNKNIEILHPLEVAIIFHGKFEKIHPFEDGNGRVGRFLINSIIVNSGYPPIIIRKSVRKSYISALQAFDSGFEDKLKHFVLEKVKETYGKFFEVYVKYV